MIQWAPILHFYQPSTINLSVVKNVLNSCYMPILDTLLENPEAQATFHIAGSLTLYLQDIQDNNFFIKVRRLIENNQVELILGPMYHPIIPLTPTESVFRQIDITRRINLDFYGYADSEFLFSPELAVSQDTIESLGKQFKYILIDQTSIEPNYLQHPFTLDQLLSFNSSTILVNNRMLTSIFRAYPRTINVHKLLDYMHETSERDIPIINANDVEVFGHHYEERIYLFRDLISNKNVRTLTLSNAIKLLQPTEIKEIHASTWQTFSEDLEENEPYAMWLNSNNYLQGYYYDLVGFAHKTLESVDQPQDDIGLMYQSAEKHFDKGTASCYPYWLSNKPWWHPVFVEKGALELIQCIRTLPVDSGTKLEGERLYIKLIQAMWEYHWSGKVEENYEAHNQYLQELHSDFYNLE